jgi:RNA polymerase sigma factor (sigma-70 family)
MPLHRYLTKDCQDLKNTPDICLYSSDEQERASRRQMARPLRGLDSSEAEAAPNINGPRPAVEPPVVRDEDAQRLLSQLTEDDFVTFCKIWEHYQPYLLGICLRRMSGIREDAEDALSKALFTAWERLPRHASAIRNVKAWLTRLTLNLCTDIQRERRRHANVVESLDALMARGHDPTHCTETPEKSALRQEMSFHLRNSINELPSRLHVPFTLRFIDGMSYEDISVRLALSPLNTRKRIQQARTFLKDRLNNYLCGETDLSTKNRYEDSERAPTNVRSIAEAKERKLREGPAHETSTMRFVQVLMRSGVERSFPLMLRRGPSKRSDSRIKTLREYVWKHPAGWKNRLKLADILYETGRWEEAIEEYRLVMKITRGLVKPYLRLGRILRLLGRDEEAAEVYRSATPALNKEADQLHLAGLLAVSLRNTGSAVHEFRRAAMLEPCEVSHTFERGMIHLSEGAYVEALEAFDDCLRIKPDDVAALTYSCEALLNAGRLRESRQRLTAALEWDGENLLALKWLADHRSGLSLVRGEEGRKTLRLIKKVMQLSSNSVQGHESLALYRLYRGEWAESISILKAYTEDHPTCPEGWHHYASLLYRVGEAASAVEAVMHAHDLNRNDWRIQQTACDILAAALQHERLLAMIDRMLTCFPNHWSTWAAAGLSLAAAEINPERACATAARGPLLQPRLPPAWFQYGRVLALAGRHADAAAALETGLSLLPEVSEQTMAALAWLGESRQHLGEHEEAQACWAEVLRHTSKCTELSQAHAHYWRGKALESLGNSGCALAYQNALQNHLAYPERHEALRGVQCLRH